MTKYDYIVGDWGYDQLRLHGFYEVGSKKGSPSQNIDRLEDYLYEYCNFGCAYFVLRNLDVQKPEPIPASAKKKPAKNADRTETFTPVTPTKPVGFVSVCLSFYPFVWCAFAA